MSESITSLKKNINYTLFSTIFNILTIMVLTPVIIKGLGTEEYGIYILLGTIIGFLGVADLGLGGATIYYVAIYTKNKDFIGVNRVFSATFWIYFVIGIVLLGLFYINSEGLLHFFNITTLGVEKGNKLIFYSITTFLLLFIASSFITIPQAVMRYDLYSYLLIGQNLIRFLVNIIAIKLGTGLLGLLISNIVVAIIYIAAAIIISHKLIPTLKVQMPDLKSIKEVFSYGIFSFFSSLIGMIWRYGDTFLISYFLGPLYVAFFSVPQQIMLRLLGLLSSTGNVLFPHYANLNSQDQKIKIFLDSTYLLTNASIIIFVPLTVVFNDFLAIWINPDFAHKTYLIAILLSSGSIIRGAFISYQALFQGIGKPKYLFYVTLLSSSTVLIGDIILIPNYGLNGAGYALLIAPVWGIITLYYTISKILEINNPIKEMLIIFIPLLFAGIDLIILFWLRTFFPLESSWIIFLEFSLLSFIVVVLSMLFVAHVLDKTILLNFLRRRDVY